MTDNDKYSQFHAFADSVNLTVAFRAQLWAKLLHGDRKYGEDSWRRHDMIAEALQETIDLGNYCYLKHRQLVAIFGNDPGMPATIAGARVRLARMAKEAEELWETLLILQDRLDRADVARSLTGEDRVGVQQGDS